MRKLSLLALPLIFTACQRNTDATNNPQPNPPTTPATTTGFVRAFELDTTLAHPYDTISRFTVTYDAQGRPSLYTYAGFKPSGDSLDLQRIQYFYNGTQTRAMRTEEYTRNHSSTPVNVNFTKKYFTWANDKLVYDSIFSTNPTYNDTVYDITRANRLGNGKVQWEQRSYSRYGSSVANGNFYQTFQGDNLTSQVDTTVWQNSGSSNTTGRTEYNTTYANVLNPFHVISYPIYEDPQYDGGALTDWFDAPKNMIIQRTRRTNGIPGTAPATPQNTWTYTYQTDAQGRVVRIKERWQAVFPATDRWRVFVIQY